MKKQIRTILEIQGYSGTWNVDPYMHGLYNGIELALSILDKREPKFRDAPKKWQSWEANVSRSIIKAIRPIVKLFQMVMRRYRINTGVKIED